jgi:hypothetical protein
MGARRYVVWDVEHSARKQGPSADIGPSQHALQARA